MLGLMGRHLGILGIWELARWHLARVSALCPTGMECLLADASSVMDWICTRARASSAVSAVSHQPRT